MADSQTQVDGGITEMWRKDGRLYAITGLLVGLALGVIILPAIGSLENAADVQAFLNDLAPELVGILITVAFIDRLNRRRDEKNEEEALKRQLIDDAASSVNEVAKNAVHQLTRRRWLSNEQGALKGASLYDADLAGAALGGANLKGARLSRANLRRADLQVADLQGAKLSGAHLQEADLWLADLQGVLLINAKLEGASLLEANLQGATLIGASFDGETMLPDKSYWTPETDMTRFTDPEHPDFWRSDKDWGPAIRGKTEA